LKLRLLKEIHIKTLIQGVKSPPPETNFPKATPSPTLSPNYIYNNGFKDTNPHRQVATKNAVKVRIVIFYIEQ